MFTLGKLQKILQPYTTVGKLAEFDLKLFKSFFNKDFNLKHGMTEMISFKKTAEEELLAIC